MGRYDLRLSESEFWRLTPRSFTALVKRLNAARRHDLYCAAMTASAIYNVHRPEDAAVITPEAMIGTNTDKSAGPKRMTVEEMKMLFQGVLVPVFGGEITEGSKQ